MKTRTITGFFFIIIMVASTLLGQYVYSIFYLLLSAFCLWEFYGLVKQSGVKPDQYTGIFTGVLVYLVVTLINFSYNDPGYHYLLLVLVPALTAIFISELFRKSSAPFINIGYTMLGIVFIVVPFCFFCALAYLNIYRGFNFHIPLAFLIILWTNDIGAYLSGYFFGRTKLFERHSPKKTWEGFIGGVIMSCVAAYILSIYYVELPWKQWISVAILISCFGTLGDLVESMFKRSINIKDSGGILPGHGGLLDRFDGLLLSAPIVYTYLYFITNS
jgi:phosphatidate cytidylyltransferase